MSLSARFASKADQRIYAVVAAGAAALSYVHARSFFLPFMGRYGASVTPLMLDAVLYWLASACIRQAAKGRPLPMLRIGAYALLSLSVTANALGGATWPERVFMALPAALFGYLTEVQIRLALYEADPAGGDTGRLAALLWLRHPVRSIRAKLWQARQRAAAFDAARAERDRLAAARDAVQLAMPGRSGAIRRARRGVLRELNAGRLAPGAAVTASGLLDMTDVHTLHRAALATALGDTPAETPGTVPDLRTEIDAVRDIFRAEVADVRDVLRTDLRTEIDAVRDIFRAEVADVRSSAEASINKAAGRAIEILRAELPAARDAAGAEDAPPDRDALVAELADEMRDAITAGDKWRPDYDALMKRTGRQRRWCEQVVADARTLAFSAPRTYDLHADHDPARADADARTEQPRLRRVPALTGTD